LDTRFLRIGSYNPNLNPPYVVARSRDGVNPT
jgi:hypothetical protein